MTPEVLALVAVGITALSTLLGVGIGGYITYKVSKTQFQATVVSTSRQDWINTLRDSIAEMQSNVALLVTSFITKEILSSEQQAEKLSRLSFLQSKVKLLLNPEEHENLIKLVDRVLPEVVKASAGMKVDLEVVNKELTQETQIVLKTEWQKIREMRA